MVEAHSETGSFAIALLDLNNEESVRYREFFESLIGEVRRKLIAAQRLLEDVENAIKGSTGNRRTQLTNALPKAKAQRNRALDEFMYVAGEFETPPS